MSVRTVQLDDVCHVTDGTHYTPPNSGGPFPFLTVKDMTMDGLEFRGCSYVAEDEFAKARSAGACPSAGDVLFSKDGTVGKVHVVSSERPFAVLSSIAILRPDRTRLDSCFLGYALRNPTILRDATDRKTGSALQRVILEDLKDVSIPLPDLSEQQRLTGLLEQADWLRRTRRYALELSDSFLPAAFLELFGDPVKNSKRFRIERLEDLIQPTRPISYGILMPGPDIPDGVPYVRVTDIREGRIEVSNVRRTTKEMDQAFKRSKLETGDLLLTIRGHVGRMGIVPAPLNGANITQDTARLATIDDLNAYYLMGCLGTESMQHFMANLTRGAAVQGINLGDVKELPIPVPPRVMQRQFAALVERHECLRATQREALRQAEHLFQTLLHRAFSEGM